MLTQGQIKYLDSIPKTQTVVIKPWSPKGLEIANKIIGDIHRIEPNLKIMLLGSLPLKIVGQEDIDISVFCMKSEQSEHIENLENYLEIRMQLVKLLFDGILKKMALV